MRAMGCTGLRPAGHVMGWIRAQVAKVLPLAVLDMGSADHGLDRPWSGPAVGWACLGLVWPSVGLDM
jgi:hypothetical protein